MDSAGGCGSGFKVCFMQFQSSTCNLHRIILISAGNMELISGICSTWGNELLGRMLFPD